MKKKENPSKLPCAKKLSSIKHRAQLKTSVLYHGLRAALDLMNMLGNECGALERVKEIEM